MIGSLLPTLAKAQDESIQQLQRSIQAGLVPAYLGIPMLEQKVKNHQRATAILMGQQQQGQPPIAEQVMQQANQITQPQQMPQMPPQAQMPQMPPQQMAQAPQGIDAAQSNLPAEGYAGGGIVAFADNKNQPVNANMPAEDDTAYDPFTGVPIYGATTTSPGLQKRLPPTNYFLDPKWKREFAKEQALNIPKIKPSAEVVPVAETKKDTGIIIHDTKPVSGTGIKREPPAPAPRTDMGIPLIYGPPEEDIVATQKAETKASYDDLKKTILGDSAERDKQLNIQTLLKIMQGGFKMAGGTSPYALANIGPAAGDTAAGIGELYAQQEAAKEKRVGQLVALGLKGNELNTELVKLGLTKKYQEMHGPALTAQAEESRARIPLLGSQAKWWAGRPYTTPGANAGAPKGIPFESMRKVEQEFEGYLANPKTIMASPLERMIPPKTDKTLGWIRQGLEASPGTPSYNNSMKAVRDIAETEKNKMYQKGYLLGGRNTASTVFSAGEE